MLSKKFWDIHFDDFTRAVAITLIVLFGINQYVNHIPSEAVYLVFSVVLFVGNEVVRRMSTAALDIHSDADANFRIFVIHHDENTPTLIKNFGNLRSDEKIFSYFNLGSKTKEEITREFENGFGGSNAILLLWSEAIGKDSYFYYELIDRLLTRYESKPFFIINEYGRKIPLMYQSKWIIHPSLDVKNVVINLLLRSVTRAQGLVKRVRVWKRTSYALALMMTISFGLSVLIAYVFHISR